MYYRTRYLSPDAVNLGFSPGRAGRAANTDRDVNRINLNNLSELSCSVANITTSSFLFNEMIQKESV